MINDIQNAILQAAHDAVIMHEIPADTDIAWFSDDFGDLLQHCHIRKRTITDSDVAGDYTYVLVLGYTEIFLADKYALDDNQSKSLANRFAAAIIKRQYELQLETSAIAKLRQQALHDAD